MKYFSFLLMCCFCLSNAQSTSYGNYQLLKLDATKNKILFIGVDNPISVEAIKPSNTTIKVTLEGPGKITNSATSGAYIANVTAEGKCKVVVSALVSGVYKQVTTEEYQIVKIPDPRPSLGGRMFGGNAQPGSILAQSGLIAILENFDFDVRFSVESYQMVYTSKGVVTTYTVVGPLFSNEIKSCLTNAKPKDILFFDNIVVKGPDGETRILGQIAFTII